VIDSTLGGGAGDGTVGGCLGVAHFCCYSLMFLPRNNVVQAFHKDI
jgi:hypothetical protein